MSLAQLFLLAAALSMDAFAVAVGMGLSMKQQIFRKAIIIGLYFGAAQAVMPLIGYFAASIIAGGFALYGNLIAFAVLTFLGIKMIVGSFKKHTCPDRVCTTNPCTDRKCPAGKQEHSLGLAAMLPLAVATSIDAMAVGVSFVFLSVNIAFASALIGVITFSIVAAGVKIGNVFGSKLGSKAELVGGIILALMGLRILLESVI